MKKAIIYTRTAKGTQDATELQTFICKKFATNNDYTVVGTLKSKGKANTERLIKYAIEKRAEFIIVSRIDRVTRNLSEFFYIAKKLQDHNIKIVSPIDLGWDAILVEKLTKSLYGSTK